MRLSLRSGLVRVVAVQNRKNVEASLEVVK